MDKQLRLDTLRASIREHEAKYEAIDLRLNILLGHKRPDYVLIKQVAQEGISLDLLIEDLKIEAKSLQEDIDLDARIENL
jgi:hypothetical protein